MTATGCAVGEIYDARREQPGWDTPSFTAPAGRAWAPATVLPTRVTMHSAMMQPIKAVEEKTAANLTVLQPTEGQPTRYVYDFGQEFAGVVRLSLPAALPAGVNVTIKHAEALSHPPIGPRDGSAFMGTRFALISGLRFPRLSAIVLRTGNLYWAHPVDYYMTKGSSEPEVYQPSFTYQYAPTRAIAT